MQKRILDSKRKFGKIPQKIIRRRKMRHWDNCVLMDSHNLRRVCHSGKDDRLAEASVF